LNIPPLMFVGTPQTNKYVINECKCIVWNITSYKGNTWNRFICLIRVCIKGIKRSATSGACTAYHSEITPVDSGVRVAQFIIFCVVFCMSLLVLLSLFFLT
jgi:hypothetical protein